MSIWRTFWLTMIAMAAIACVTALATSPAPAQMQVQACAPAEYVLRRLQERYGEEPHMHLKAGRSTLLLTLSDDGNWTLLQMQGVHACMVASGTDARKDVGL